MSLVTPHDPGSLPRQPSRRTSVAIARASTLVTPAGRIDAAVASRAAPSHVVNEDAHSELRPGSTLFVVADGVGGGALAACASRELVARLHASLDGVVLDAASVRDAIIDADRVVARAIAARTAARGASTMALCAALAPTLEQWLVAWVGDCRAYRVSAHGMHAEALTVDDTYRHLNEPPPQGGSLDDPARMVGNGAVGAPNVRRIELDVGDMLVLCSDGVHQHISAADIGCLMQAPLPLVRRCARLVELAHANGSRDDATMLAVRRDDRYHVERPR